MTDPVAAVRGLFEALLAGHAVVAETDEDAARELLIRLGDCLSDRAWEFKRALGGGSEDAIAEGAEPFAEMAFRDGTLKLYWPKVGPS